MKKNYLLVVFFLLIPFVVQTAVINQIIASVGNIAITSFDIQQMRSFEEKISQKRPSSSEALTKLINMTSLLIIAEDSPEYYMDESELRKTINSMTNNPSDPNNEQRKQLYNTYSSLYRMMIRSDKVKRSLMFNNVNIKAEVNQPINVQESRNFYNKNKQQFKDSPFPKFDLTIFAVEASPRWSLSELTEVEEQMAQLAKALDTSNDFDALKKQFSSLRFTPYSGNTGLFTPDILILQKKIPDEILGIAMQNTLNLGTINIPIQKNKGIFIPQPIPFRNTGKSTYLTMKIIDLVQPKQLTFEQALLKVEELIRYQRAEKAVSKLIKERIEAGQITLTATDNSYRSVFREFNQK